MTAAAHALPRSFEWKWSSSAVRRSHGLHRRGAARFSAVAKLLHAADGVQGGAVHARQLRAGLRLVRHARLFWNSLQFAVGASLFSFVLGTALAWMNERTNTPFKTLLLRALDHSAVIPGILFTVA